MYGELVTKTILREYNSYYPKLVTILYISDYKYYFSDNRFMLPKPVKEGWISGYGNYYPANIIHVTQFLKFLCPEDEFKDNTIHVDIARYNVLFSISG